MVAAGSSQFSSSVSVQDNGSRNKRKFRADPPLGDANKVQPFPQMDCPTFEFGKSQNDPSTEQPDFSFLGTQRPLNLGCDESRVESEVEESQDVYWSVDVVTKLEELVLSNLDIFFKSVIKKIASCGYSEEVTAEAIMKSGLCYGCKDTESNIVENTLAFLKNGQEMVSSGDKYFTNLEQLEKSVLDEMVHVLMEVRPSFTRGDALWCLLKCDMNLSQACAMDGDPLGSSVSDEITGNCSESTGSQLKPEDNSSPSTPKLYNPKPKKPNHIEVKESPYSSADAVEESSAVNEKSFSTISRSSPSQSSAPDGKSDGARKGRANVFRREAVHRQKHFHVEKMHRTFGAKGTSKSGKPSGLSSSFLDKKCKSVTDSATLNLNASLSISKAIGVDPSQTDSNTDLSTKAKLAFESGSDPKAGDSASGLPLASTELSLSLPSESNDASRPVCHVETDDYCSHGRSSSDKVSAKRLTNDKMLLKLVQIQKFEEWGKQKVKEAIYTLNKHKAELNTLRQEKEEVVRLKKEKQALEENTTKKLVEMENALCKAGGQVERANATVRVLELENCQLRQEMENAKSRAAQSALGCQDVTRREEEMSKKIQSLEKQKALFQEDLVTKKRELSLLQRQLEQAKEFRDQLESRWKQEEKMKEQAREQLEALAKSKEDMIIPKAESDFQRYQDVIRRLEKEIAQLRLKTDSSKIAALHWGTDVTYALRLTNSKSIAAVKETGPHYVSENVDFHGDVTRDRECVMCLSDEMSVVFLPCAHLVVCVKCNELHQKHGMKECPSCRITIQRRICVRSADT
ncbi:hypothetical protein MRB53_028132 [Persea americana]|uniref:Uncharacterized protein n=1 Tax=Persea americana TaxID=3435 RepID=A0ACC2KFB9_PERAE|nr:hypothetical protein MRB53_028132 [Persea americana]